MLVLFETSAGYALFKLLDENKLKNIDNIWEEFSTAAKAQQCLQLISFKKFKDTAEALDSMNHLMEGKLAKTLKKALKGKIDDTEQLAVGDTKLGSIIKEKMDVKCVCNSAIAELMRGIRTHIESLLGEHKQEMNAMNLALAHSLGRYKVKFDPDKIDTMIVQAVSLLDDIDKELNNYIMRCREWYGWHFPELGKIIQDHQAYAQVVRKLGMRQDAEKVDLSDLLPEELEARVKDEAEISTGCDISISDLTNIKMLCDQVVELSAYRAQLAEYLKNRMAALAPNLTVLLGELVGARLISHAGSLINLAKYPASTVQILGAEKALFRALKSKRDTPKYGIIYHAQLIGQASAKTKGKLARKLAAKVSLATRIDALADESHGSQMGLESRAYLEQVIRSEQERGAKRISGVATAHEPYRFKSEVLDYDDAMDSTQQKGRKRKIFGEDEGDEGGDGEKPIAMTNGGSAAASATKRFKQEVEGEIEEAEVTPKESSHKKKKKKIKMEPQEGDGEGQGEEHIHEEEEEQQQQQQGEGGILLDETSSTTTTTTPKEKHKKKKKKAKGGESEEE